MPDCLFNQHECETNHKAIDSKFTSMTWVFGIIITIQLSFCAFVGWLSTKVNTMEVQQSSNTAKLLDVDRIQQQVLVKLDKNSDKLDEINKAVAKLKP